MAPVKRWVGLTPGQQWHLDNGETLKLISFTKDGEFIFEISDGADCRLVQAAYKLVDNYLEQNGGALVT